jgi:hypothetical protein
MLPKSLSAALLVTILAMTGATQAMPLAPVTPPSVVENASFWAQPYPYGYRWRKTPCVRYVPTCGNALVPACEVRWQRVWVCR